MSGVPVVIPLSCGSSRGDMELRMLLRSLEACASDLGDIILVTEHVPAWLDRSQVRVLRAGDRYAANKDANLHAKTLAAIREFGLREFAWSADDCALLRPMRLADIPAMHNHRPLSMFQECDGNRWRMRVRATLEWARMRGADLPHQYECHAPQLFDGQAILRGMQGVDYGRQPGLTIYTAWRVVTGTWRDTHDQRDHKWTFELPMDESAATMPESLLRSKLFLGYNDAAADRVLARLQKLYPSRSKYEL